MDVFSGQNIDWMRLKVNNRSFVIEEKKEYRLDEYILVENQRENLEGF